MTVRRTARGQGLNDSWWKNNAEQPKLHSRLLVAWGPAVDVDEYKDNVFVKAELPGMKKDEIEVSMSGNMLNIAGQRKEEAEFKGAKSYRSERYFGRFQRSVRLPATVKARKIEAHYKDGVLTLTCAR